MVPTCDHGQEPNGADQAAHRGCLTTVRRLSGEVQVTGAGQDVELGVPSDVVDQPVAAVAEREDVFEMADETHDRGPEFDWVRIGRPATGALIDAGYRQLPDLPERLESLVELHGVGPAAIRRLQAARDGS